MEAIVRHLVVPIVKHPDDVTVQIVEEGEATVMMELRVNPEDVERVQGAGGRTLRAIRNVLSAAAGHKKATLDLVEPGDGVAAASGEE